MPLAIHARAQSDLTQKFHSAGLQHSGANSLQHMGAALPLQYDAVDAVAIENMGQQQAGRATADDRHLGSRRHDRSLVSENSRRGVARIERQRNPGSPYQYSLSIRQRRPRFRWRSVRAM